MFTDELGRGFVCLHLPFIVLSLSIFCRVYACGCIEDIGACLIAKLSPSLSTHSF